LKHKCDSFYLLGKGGCGDDDGDDDDDDDNNNNNSCNNTQVSVQTRSCNSTKGPRGANRPVFW